MSITAWPAEQLKRSIRPASGLETRIPIARPASPVTDAELIRAFPRQSLTLLTLLTALTSGLYLAYWFDRQSRIVTRLNLERQIPAGLVRAMWILCGLNTALSLFEWSIGLSLGAFIFSALIGNLAAIVSVVAAFHLRGRLNELFEAAASAPCARPISFSATGTLLFNVVYLQWKINHLRRQLLPE